MPIIRQAAHWVKEPIITIEHHERIYQRGCPGPAWYWTYAVNVPGCPHAFVGSCVDWARQVARQYSRVTGYPVDDRTRRKHDD